MVDDDDDEYDHDDLQDPFFTVPANLENKSVDFLLTCNLGKPVI